MSDFLHKLPQFIGNHMALAALFVVLLVALVVTQLMEMFAKTRTLSPAGLTQLINRDNPLLIDLSPRDAFEKGHIPGARHVAMSQFDPENKSLAAAKTLPVVLICRSGQTASQAARRLLRAGFTSVHVLGGGMAAWQQAQLPVAKGSK